MKPKDTIKPEAPRTRSGSERPLALTEQRNPLSEDIDVKSSLDIVEIINREDSRISQAVFEARASIATAIDWATQAFSEGGRLFYVGAGTSGRLGQLDASECPPTFGVPPELVQALVAGGPGALTRAIEGAEDDPKAGARDVRKRKIRGKDLVIGISSGATTPYVRGALEEARRRKCRTVLITSTSVPEPKAVADLLISLLTGAEIITGSTRMKAGTAAKMALNMISTGAMIRTGRTYGNLMVDLRCSNRKLVRRGIRILRGVTRLGEEEAAALLKNADGHVTTALAMGVLGIPRGKAEILLKDNDGFLRRLFTHPHRKNPKIDAVIFDMDGTILQYGLPSGFSTWAAIGWAFGIYEKMGEWVDQYFHRKMSYREIWERCAHEVRGRNFSEVKDVLFPCSGMPPYSRGFVDCVHALKEHYRTGIVSSGLSMVSEEIRKTLGLDFEVSNTMGLSQGKFDGTVRIKVPFDQKLEALERQANRLGIPLSRICFVGDSTNDIEAMRAVGLPVAYNPKSEAVATAAGGNVIGDFLQLGPLIERF
ncbi:MAG: N-acetylmuramic acid 6-phosphate etherase [Pseudomonadota bacterium]